MEERVVQEELVMVPVAVEVLAALEAEEMVLLVLCTLNGKITF
jgi:hypothetical protein